MERNGLRDYSYQPFAGAGAVNASIFGKLGVRDRAAAIVFAYDHGVVTPGLTLK